MITGKPIGIGRALEKYSKDEMYSLIKDAFWTQLLKNRENDISDLSEESAIMFLLVRNNLKEGIEYLLENAKG